MQTSGKSCRENAKSYSVVVVFSRRPGERRDPYAAAEIV